VPNMSTGYGWRHWRNDIPWQAWKQGLNSALVMEAFSPSFVRTVRFPPHCSIYGNKSAYILRRERNTRHRKRITVRKVGKPYLVYVFLFGMRWEIVSFSPITESMLHKNSLYRYNTLFWNQKKIYEYCVIVDIYLNIDSKNIFKLKNT
jgi:hypothetical protein